MDEKYKLLGKLEIFEIFDVNSIEKLLLKIERSETTSCFYNTFLHFGTFPLFPLAASMNKYTEQAEIGSFRLQTKRQGISRHLRNFEINCKNI